MVRAAASKGGLESRSSVRSNSCVCRERSVCHPNKPAASAARTPSGKYQLERSQSTIEPPCLATGAGAAALGTIAIAIAGAGVGFSTDAGTGASVGGSFRTSCGDCAGEGVGATTGVGVLWALRDPSCACMRANSAFFNSSSRWDSVSCACNAVTRCCRAEVSPAEALLAALVPGSEGATRCNWPALLLPAQAWYCEPTSERASPGPIAATVAASGSCSAAPARSTFMLPTKAAELAR